MNLVAIDPGESIGMVWGDGYKTIGTTIKGDRRLSELWYTLKEIKPDLVIFEEFALRQSAANKLAGSKFITCEVIGAIKLFCQLNSVPMCPLLPVTKEYCGFSSNPKNENYRQVVMPSGEKITEHVRDAFRLLSYAKLFEVKNGS